MVTISSTRRERLSAARSENRAAEDHREPFCGTWPFDSRGCEASLMYLSSADGLVSLGFFLSLEESWAASTAAQHSDIRKIRFIGSDRWGSARWGSARWGPARW